MTINLGKRPAWRSWESRVSGVRVDRVTKQKEISYILVVSSLLQATDGAVLVLVVTSVGRRSFAREERRASNISYQSLSLSILHLSSPYLTCVFFSAHLLSPHVTDLQYVVDLIDKDVYDMIIAVQAEIFSRNQIAAVSGWGASVWSDQPSFASLLVFLVPLSSCASFQRPMIAVPSATQRCSGLNYLLVVAVVVGHCHWVLDVSWYKHCRSCSW